MKVKVNPVIGKIFVTASVFFVGGTVLTRGNSIPVSWDCNSENARGEAPYACELREEAQRAFFSKNFLKAPCDSPKTFSLTIQNQENLAQSLDKVELSNFANQLRDNYNSVADQYVPVPEPSQVERGPFAEWRYLSQRTSKYLLDPRQQDEPLKIYIDRIVHPWKQEYVYSVRSGSIKIERSGPREIYANHLKKNVALFLLTQ